MNEVSYTPRAAKQLRKLSAIENKSIRTACNGLSAMPNCSNVKALINHSCQYRLRVGNYRVFFNFDGVIHVVTIEEVKKRNENTY